MSLQLATEDVRHLADAAYVLAAPGEFDTPAAWRAEGAARVRAVFGADRLLWLMPPCRAGGQPDAPTAACFYGEGLDDGVVAAHERMRAAVPDRPTDPAEAELVQLLTARHALGATVWTGPRLMARIAELPWVPLRARRSPFLHDVTIPSGLWACACLGAGGPGRDVFLMVGDRRGPGVRFTEEDALAVGHLLRPALVVGVRAALARWAVPDAGPAAPSLGAVRGERAGLTAREREIAGFLRGRRTNREISAALGISEATARHHTEHVLRKLGVGSRRDIGAALDPRGTAAQ